MSQNLTAQQIADLIAGDRTALAQFENTYQALEPSEGETAGRDLKSLMAYFKKAQADTEAGGWYDPVALEAVTARIIEEITNPVKAIEPAQGEPLVSVEELAAFPPAVRPQFAAQVIARTSPFADTELIAGYWQQYAAAPTTTEGRYAYSMFRVGLDLCDLSDFTYALLGQNINSMGYWLPPLQAAAAHVPFFKIPETRIVRVPLPILQLTRIDYHEITDATKAALNAWAMRAFNLDTSRKYFVKTGVKCSKFFFRNAVVEGEQEIRELGEYLLLTHHQDVAMSGPYTGLYGVATTNEWVVREYIEDAENNPTIYNGLPLRTEYRFFIDAEAKSILGVSPYWEPETMKDRFENHADATSPDMLHDAVIYRAHEPTLMGRYHQHLEEVTAAVRELLPHLNLPGQWSLDIMQNGDDFYLIDMAAASTSALSQCVPAGLIRPVEVLQLETGKK